MKSRISFVIKEGGHTTIIPIEKDGYTAEEYAAFAAEAEAIIKSAPSVPAGPVSVDIAGAVSDEHGNFPPNKHLGTIQTTPAGLYDIQEHILHHAHKNDRKRLHKHHNVV